MNKTLQTALRHQHAGDFKQAERLYKQVLQNNPKDNDALHLLGTLALQANRPDAALQLIDQAIKIAPEQAEYWLNLALAQSRLNQLSNALESIDRATALKPQFIEALYHKGNILLTHGQLVEAEQTYRQLLDKRPKYTSALEKLGLVMQRQGRLEEAEQNYRAALKLSPKQPALLVDLGNIYTAKRQFKNAANSYQRALQLQPNHLVALDNLTAIQLKLCDWRHLDKIRSRLLQPVLQNWQQSPFAVRPFTVAQLPIPISSLERLQLARAMTRLRTQTYSTLRPRLGFEHSANMRTRLRIGYLSADFNNHATTHLIQGLFGRHQRPEFEIFAYSIGKDDESHNRKRVEQDVDTFRDLQSTGIIESAQRIYEDGIDILVDLNGHAGSNRLEILALKPVPIQVTYLGHPGTLGADFVDYIITDEIVTPSSEQPYYDEHFVTLPYSYQVNDCDRKIAAITPARGDYHLPEQSFVFCSFCAHQKIEPEIFATWMRMLKRVPDSVLWILDGASEALANLRAAATQHGIDGARLITAPRIEAAEHLARHRLADLFLDTYFYNGHTTVSDALWAGLPVLTCPQDSFPSRVGASLLTAVGLPELIMTDLAAYEDKAVALAENPAELQALKNKLGALIPKTPLFDTAGFARQLESAYREMWSIYQAGEAPRPIKVEHY